MVRAIEWAGWPRCERAAPGKRFPPVLERFYSIGERYFQKRPECLLFSPGKRVAGLARLEPSRLEDRVCGGKGGVGGGGTNQQPSGKSNFPHPRERTRAAALEGTGLEPCDCPRGSLAAAASAHNVARRRGDGEEARDSGTCVRVGVETCPG